MGGYFVNERDQFLIAALRFGYQIFDEPEPKFSDRDVVAVLSVVLDKFE